MSGLLQKMFIPKNLRNRGTPSYTGSRASHLAQRGKMKNPPFKQKTRGVPPYHEPGEYPNDLEHQQGLDVEEGARSLDRRLITVGVHMAGENGYDEASEDPPDQEPEDKDNDDEQARLLKQDEEIKKQLALERQKTKEEVMNEVLEASKRQNAELDAEKEEQRKNDIKYAKERIMSGSDNAPGNGYDAAIMMSQIDYWVKDDWVSGTAIAGNMYRVWAFGGFARPCINDGYHETLRQKIDRLSQFAGTMAIMIIQITAPPLIIAGIVLGWGAEQEVDFSSCFLDWSKNDEWSKKRSTRTLGLMFLICFLVNSVQCAIGESEDFHMVWGVFKRLNLDNVPNMYLNPLYIGPFVNCWVNVTCCIAMFLIMGISNNPKDIVFDSLGIMFLFNLDDVGGDMAFIDQSQWPGSKLYWIWYNMVRQKKPTEPVMEFDDESGEMVIVDYTWYEGDEPDDDDLTLNEEPEVDCLIAGLYTLTNMTLLLLLFILPVLYVIMPWSACEVEADAATTAAP